MLRDLPEWRTWREYRESSRHGGCTASFVYAVQFDSDVVKIGWTYAPGLRIRTLYTESRRFRVRIVDGWISPAHFGANATEVTALAWARSNFEPVTVEYFTGLDVPAVTEFVSGLALNLCNTHYRFSDGSRSALAA